MVTVTGGSGSRGDRLAIIPDALPILSKGRHPPGSGRMCGLDAISWLSGRPEEGAAPSCVHPVLGHVIGRVNDELPRARRHELWPSLLRAMYTYPTGLDAHDDQLLSVRLALWSARRLAHLVSEEDRVGCNRAVKLVEAWCDGSITDAERRELWAGPRAFVSSAYFGAPYAAYAAHATVVAAANASAVTHDDAYAQYATGHSVTIAARCAAVAAMHAAGASHDGVDAACEARLAMLDGLLTEYDRLTGHAPPDVPADLIAELGRIVGTVPA